MSDPAKTPEGLSSSSYVQGILAEVATDEYQERMDYFTGPSIIEPTQPTSAVEAAQQRAAAIQAGKAILSL